jgi:hypothetical protein
MLTAYDARDRRRYARWLGLILVRRNPLARRVLFIAGVTAASLAALTLAAVVAVGVLVF